jgi:prophage antirepressor-like protein
MRSSLALLDEDEKGVHSMDTPGGRQNLTIVSESGLYSLILRSRKAEAKQFKRWITREVLPSIRKTGSYSAPVSKELEEARIIQQALQISYRRQQEAEAKLAAAKPKADAWDHIVSSAGSWSYEEAAKVLFEQGVVTIGQKRLAQQLVDWRFLYRDSKGRPHVYQQYLEQGLFAVKARTYTDMETGEIRQSSAPQVRITGKGLDMLFRRFREGQMEVAA